MHANNLTHKDFFELLHDAHIFLIKIHNVQRGLSFPTCVVSGPGMTQAFQIKNCCSCSSGSCNDFQVIIIEPTFPINMIARVQRLVIRAIRYLMSQTYDKLNHGQVSNKKKSRTGLDFEPNTFRSSD